MSLLRSYLDEYLSAQRSGRTLSALARRSGVGETTLRRIVQGECKPELATAMALLGAVTTRDNMVQVLHELYPDEAKLMESAFASQKGQKSSSPDASETINRLLSQEVSCRVIHLAATREGSTRERIRQLWGVPGELALDECLTCGVLEESGGKIRFPDEGFTLTDIGTAIQVCKHLVSTFDRRNLGQRRACLAVETEAVNEEGLMRVREVMLKAAQEISQIKEDPQYQGRIPFYVTLVMNTLDNPSA